MRQVIAVCYCALALLLSGVPKASADPKVIAIDGVTGFVGGTLLPYLTAGRKLGDIDLKVNCMSCDEEKDIEDVPEFSRGKIYDSEHLKAFLKSVDVYYLIAAISAVDADLKVADEQVFEEYLLSNTLGPLLASRVNKEMTLVALSSVVVKDLTLNSELSAWISLFLKEFKSIGDKSVSASKLRQQVESFLKTRSVPCKSEQYYALSKYLMEQLLEDSSSTRSGKIAIIRPAHVTGKNMMLRKGKSVVKNILKALFFKRKYEVWNRLNCFTPVDRLVSMMTFVGQEEGRSLIGKFERLDSGCVPMSQHEFAELVVDEVKDQYEGFDDTALVYVNSGIGMSFHVMDEDERFMRFYPNMDSLKMSVFEMVEAFKDKVETPRTPATGKQFPAPSRQKTPDRHKTPELLSLVSSTHINRTDTRPSN